MEGMEAMVKLLSNIQTILSNGNKVSGGGGGGGAQSSGGGGGGGGYATGGGIGNDMAAFIKALHQYPKGADKASTVIKDIARGGKDMVDMLKSAKSVGGFNKVKTAFKELAEAVHVMDVGDSQIKGAKNTMASVSSVMSDYVACVGVLGSKRIKSKTINANVDSMINIMEKVSNSKLDVKKIQIFTNSALSLQKLTFDDGGPSESLSKSLMSSMFGVGKNKSNNLTAIHETVLCFLVKVSDATLNTANINAYVRASSQILSPKIKNLASLVASVPSLYMLMFVNKRILKLIQDISEASDAHFNERKLRMFVNFLPVVAAGMPSNVLKSMGMKISTAHSIEALEDVRLFIGKLGVTTMDPKKIKTFTSFLPAVSAGMSANVLKAAGMAITIPIILRVMANVRGFMVSLSEHMNPKVEKGVKTYVDSSTKLFKAAGTTTKGLKLYAISTVFVRAGLKAIDIIHNKIIEFGEKGAIDKKTSSSIDTFVNAVEKIMKLGGIVMLGSLALTLSIPLLYGSLLAIDVLNRLIAKASKLDDKNLDKIDAITWTITKMAVGIGLALLLVTAASSIAGGNMLAAMGMILVMVVGVGLIAYGLSLISHIFKSSAEIQEVSKTLGSVMLLLVVIAIGVTVISMLSTQMGGLGEMMMALLSITVVVLLVVGIAWLLSKIMSFVNESAMVSASLTIMLMMLCLIVVAGGITLINLMMKDMDLMETALNMLTLVGILVAIAGVMWLLGKFGGAVAQGVMVALVIIVVLFLLSLVVKMVVEISKSIEFGDLCIAVGELVGVLAIMGLAIAALGFLLPFVAMGFATVSMIMVSVMFTVLIIQMLDKLMPTPAAIKSLQHTVNALFGVTGDDGVQTSPSVMLMIANGISTLGGFGLMIGVGLGMATITLVAVAVVLLVVVVTSLRLISTMDLGLISSQMYPLFGGVYNDVDYGDGVVYRVGSAISSMWWMIIPLTMSLPAVLLLTASILLIWASVAALKKLSEYDSASISVGALATFDSIMSFADTLCDREFADEDDLEDIYDSIDELVDIVERLGDGVDVITDVLKKTQGDASKLPVAAKQIMDSLMIFFDSIATMAGTDVLKSSVEAIKMMQPILGGSVTTGGLFSGMTTTTTPSIFDALKSFGEAITLWGTNPTYKNAAGEEVPIDFEGAATNMGTSLKAFMDGLKGITADPNLIATIKTVASFLLGEAAIDKAWYQSGPSVPAQPSIIDALTGFGDVVKQFSEKPFYLDENGKKVEVSYEQVANNIVESINKFITILSRDLDVSKNKGLAVKLNSICSLLSGGSVTEGDKTVTTVGIMDIFSNFADIMEKFTKGKMKDAKGNETLINWSLLAADVSKAFVDFITSLAKGLSGNDIKMGVKNVTDVLFGTPNANPLSTEKPKTIGDVVTMIKDFATSLQTVSKVSNLQKIAANIVTGFKNFITELGTLTITDASLVKLGNTFISMDNVLNGTPVKGTRLRLVGLKTVIASMVSLMTDAEKVAKIKVTPKSIISTISELMKGFSNAELVKNMGTVHTMLADYSSMFTYKNDKTQGQVTLEYVVESFLQMMNGSFDYDVLPTRSKKVGESLSTLYESICKMNWSGKNADENVVDLIDGGNKGIANTIKLFDQMIAREEPLKKFVVVMEQLAVAANNTSSALALAAAKQLEIEKNKEEAEKKKIEEELKNSQNKNKPETVQESNTALAKALREFTEALKNKRLMGNGTVKVKSEGIYDITF